jgi:hypothetical protein
VVGVLFSCKYLSAEYPKRSTAVWSHPFVRLSSWKVFSFCLYAASWSEVMPWLSATLTLAP